jgi:quercetin dioxygenase-like cupin family protein
MQQRVVTGVDADGRSIIVEHGRPAVVTPAPGLSLAEQWMCERTAPDAAIDGFALTPPRGGALFRLVAFAPDPDGQMHRTDTVDFAVVVAGELVLALDGGEEVTLRQGDTVIQRSATHAWRNRTGEEAVLAVVLLDAEG